MGEKVALFLVLAGGGAVHLRFVLSKSFLIFIGVDERAIRKPPQQAPLIGRVEAVVMIEAVSSSNAPGTDVLVLLSSLF